MTSSQDPNLAINPDFLINYPDLQLAFAESRLGVVASDIVEFDTISIKVVQDCSAIFITHTVVRLSASITEK